MHYALFIVRAYVTICMYVVLITITKNTHQLYKDTHFLLPLCYRDE